MKSTFSQMCVHEETGYAFEVVSIDAEMISKFTPIFQEADKVIGAQFYYTNPVLYMLIDDLDEDACACMYANYYLINTSGDHSHEFVPGIAAVNYVFLERIGSYKENASKLGENFEAFRRAHGLYLVGIDVNARSDDNEYKGWEDELPNEEPL